jgi:hypothetical protein
MSIERRGFSRIQWLRGRDASASQLLENHPASGRVVAAWVFWALAVVFLAFIAARPTALLGVSGAALDRSIGDSSSGDPTGPCRHVGGSMWICSRHDDQFSGTVSYKVKVDDFGCWEAERFGSPGEGSDRHMSGCVTFLAYLFS